MKKAFFGVALALLAPILFSFVSTNGNLVAPASRLIIKSVISDEKPKKGKNDKKDNTKQTCGVWFLVNSNSTVPCTSLTLVHPTASTPPPTNPTNFGCSVEVLQYYCAVSYPRAILKADGKYYPADASGIEIPPTSYCNFICAQYRNEEF